MKMLNERNHTVVTADGNDPVVLTLENGDVYSLREITTANGCRLLSIRTMNSDMRIEPIMANTIRLEEVR